MHFDDPRFNWASASSHMIGEYFDVAKPLIDKDYEGLDPHIRFVSTQLFIDCHLTSESVLLLVSHGKEWDADILARAVVEGTLKYVHLMTGTNEDMIRKATEYWLTLPGYASVKRSERAKSLLEMLPADDDQEWRAYRDVLLSEIDVNEARGESNRRERNILEEQWSFNGIIRAFVNSGRKDLKSFAGLVIQYANSSHMLHKDGDGVAMVWDRYQRNAERQAAITMAHAGRLVSDICVFASVRLRFLLRACGKARDEIEAVDRRYEGLFEEFERADEDFRRVEYGDAAPGN